MTAHKHAVLNVLGDALPVDQISGREALGEAFAYDLAWTTPVGVDPRALLVVGATLELSDAIGYRRAVTGVLTEVQVVRGDHGRDRVRARLRPDAHRMALGCDNRSFQDASAVDVARHVLARASVTSRFEQTSEHAAKPYRVQRSESDWAFLHRLFAVDGLYSYFDHGENSVFVVTDAAPPVDDLVLPFREDRDLAESEESIAELAVGAAVQPGRVLVSAFDCDRPRLAIGAGAGVSGPELYDAGGAGPTSPEAAARAAALSSERHAVGAKKIVGVASSIRLFPGRRMLVSGSTLDGSYLVVAVQIVARGAARTFSTRFEAIPAERPFRLPVPQPREQAGVSFGAVVGPAGREVHPDPRGRVRVKAAWDRAARSDAGAGAWMRATQRGVSGSMMLPRVGWTVAMVNDEADVDAPLVLFRSFDSKNVPPYPLPENKTRVVYKTATSPGGGSHNEIHFEDREGAQNLFIHASRDMSVLTLNDRIDEVDNDAIYRVRRDQRVDVEGRSTEAVERTQRTVVGGDDTLEILGRHGEEVKLFDRRVVGKTDKLVVDGDASLSVQGSRDLTVGAAMLETSLGSIASQGRHAVDLVGALALRATGQSLLETVKKLSVKLVGALRIEDAGGSVSTDISRSSTTVVGAETVSAGGNYAREADTTIEEEVTGSLRLTARELRLEGRKGITLRCGKNVVRIEKGSITVDAGTVELEAGPFTVETRKLSHNS